MEKECRYIGLAFVEIMSSGERYLFEMPKWCNLKKGDLVLCEISHGPEQGIVIATDTFEENSDDFNKWIDIANTQLPLKKIAGVFKTFKYPQDGKSNA